jgi:DNA polymerase elongation subunit (family B)
MGKQRILTLDIETSPAEGYFWNPWQTNIAEGQMTQQTVMLTYAAKWLGDRKVIYRTGLDEDFHRTLHQLLDEADAVVSYNGDGFDFKHIMREFAERGMHRPKPFASIDLYKTVKREFKFMYNKLDYVCFKLLGKRKTSTGGFDLWPSFMAGCTSAARLMRRYNIMDTRLTEELYLYLRPWIKNHPHVSHEFVDFKDLKSDYRCPSCDSPKVVRRGHRRTRCYAIRQVQCCKCGSWQDGKRIKL